MAKRLTKKLKLLLDILIVLFSVLIVSVIWTGGFEIRILGHKVSCNNLVNPVLILTVLGSLRFFFSVDRKNALVVMGSLLLAAVLVESSLRILNTPMTLPALKEIVEPYPVLGYRLVPLLRDKRIQTNSDGLRDRERSVVKPAGERRLLGIGDSFTFGYRVDLEECYLKQLERRLNQGDERWDVINAGVSGYNMWQYLAYFKHFGYRYDPDLVTIGLFFDDFNGDPPKEVEEQHLERYRAFSFLRIVNFSRNCLDLFQYAYRHLFDAGWLRSIADRMEHIKGTQDYLLLTGKADSALYGNFEGRLRELSVLARTRGSQVLVILIPDVVQVKRPELQALNGITRDICDRCTVDFMDMTPVFETIHETRSLYLLPYDAHISPEGHRIIAEELEKKIRMMMDCRRG